MWENRISPCAAGGISDPFERLRIRYDTGLPLCAGRRRRSFHTPDFDKSVETVINIHARRYRKGDLSRRYDVIRNIAYVKGKNVVMVNQVGGATELVYDGMSGVMDNRGKLVRLLKSFEEDFQVFDTENPACSVESVPVSVNDRTRFIYEAACCGLRDFFVKNGYKKACVGVSGGIDSAVVACLAVAALGRRTCGD